MVPILMPCLGGLLQEKELLSRRISFERFQTQPSVQN